MEVGAFIFQCNPLPCTSPCPTPSRGPQLLRCHHLLHQMVTTDVFLHIGSSLISNQENRMNSYTHSWVAATPENQWAGVFPSCKLPMPNLDLCYKISVVSPRNRQFRFLDSPLTVDQCRPHSCFHSICCSFMSGWKILNFIRIGHKDGRLARKQVH